MGDESVAVVGGGACALGLAVDLILRDHSVLILEHPSFRSNVEPLLNGELISYTGVLGEGRVKPTGVSLDAADVTAHRAVDLRHRSSLRPCRVCFLARTLLGRRANPGCQSRSGHGCLCVQEAAL